MKGRKKESSLNHEASFDKLAELVIYNPASLTSKQIKDIREWVSRHLNFLEDHEMIIDKQGKPNPNKVHFVYHKIKPEFRKGI